MAEQAMNEDDASSPGSQSSPIGMDGGYALTSVNVQCDCGGALWRLIELCKAMPCYHASQLLLSGAA